MLGAPTISLRATNHHRASVALGCSAHDFSSPLTFSERDMVLLIGEEPGEWFSLAEIRAQVGRWTEDTKKRDVLMQYILGASSKNAIRLMIGAFALGPLPDHLRNSKSPKADSRSVLIVVSSLAMRDCDEQALGMADSTAYKRLQLKTITVLTMYLIPWFYRCPLDVYAHGELRK